mgnify:CR=1 FL=1
MSLENGDSELFDGVQCLNRDRYLQLSGHDGRRSGLSGGEGYPLQIIEGDAGLAPGFADIYQLAKFHSGEGCYLVGFSIMSLMAAALAWSRSTSVSSMVKLIPWNRMRSPPAAVTSSITLPAESKSRSLTTS